MNTNQQTASSSSSNYSSNYSTSNPMVQQVLLPTQIVERPVAVHEEIRKELVEEIQPVVNVEKIHTEIHQVTQPLFDKEVRAVNISERVLPTETLPELLIQGRGARAADDISTTRFLDTQTVVVEKPAVFNEIERRQIIEEIQPVIYKETVVPTVIQETKPIYQKIVEGAVYSQETLPSRQVSDPSMINPGYVPDMTVIAPVTERMVLPTQVVEKPVAVHEEIRREMVEEIQPVFNVEKLKTEVHQITAPLFDKEVMPVTYEKRVLAQEVLPEVFVQGRGVAAVQDVSTTRYLDTRSEVIEKPAIYREVERTQVIEEIQPIVYKETVVPSVLRETKPIYQKIVEGPVYTQQTLAPRQLSETNFHYPTGMQAPIQFPSDVPVVVREVSQPIMTQPIMAQPIIEETLPIREVIVVEEVAPLQPHHRKEIIEETVTTTTTTTTAPIVGAAANTTNAKQHHGLFHRNSKGNLNNTGATGNTSYTTTSTGLNNSGFNSGLSTGLNNSSNLPRGNYHEHHETVGANGQKIIEDVTSTSSHTEAVIPARLV